MAERKKTSGSKSETEAKREAESKGTGKGGPREAKKAESKGRAQATKKAESGKKAGPKAKAPAKTKESPAKTAEPQTAEKPKKKTPAKTKAETKPKAAAKPKTSKAKAKEAPERPVVNARARYVRIAPRKARLVANQVRGLPLEQALQLLRFHQRSAARDIAKLLGSAAANAEANHDLVADELRISDIRVDEGPTLRRYRPRALGRATKINKRTSHIQVALTPED